jgi:hypothetical protein
MKILTSVIALLLIAPGAHAAKNLPTFQFGQTEVMLSGAIPGNRISWVGMVREFDGSVPRMRIVRGLEVAAAGEELSLAAGLDPSCSAWAVGGVDQSLTMVQSGDRCAISEDPIAVTAIPGQDRFVVESSIVFGNYLGLENSAWRFSVRDGSELDADGKINDQIVILLSTLESLKESPAPPETIGEGDTLLLLDSDQMRATAFEVQP